MSDFYTTKNKLKCTTFQEAELDVLLSKVSEWIKEEVKDNKELNHKRSFYILDVMVHFDGEYHIAHIYHSAEMPQ